MYASLHLFKNEFFSQLHTCMDWPIDFRPEILVDNIGSVVKQLTTSMKILVWRELATVTNAMGAFLTLTFLETQALSTRMISH